MYNSRHSNSGAAEAEINFRRFQVHKRAREAGRFDDSAQDYLRYIESKDGKEERRKLEKALDSPAPAYLDPELTGG